VPSAEIKTSIKVLKQLKVLLSLAHL